MRPITRIISGPPGRHTAHRRTANGTPPPAPAVPPRFDRWATPSDPWPHARADATTLELWQEETR